MIKVAKLLPTLIAIEITLILAIFALSSFEKQNIPTAYVVKETPGKQDFKLITKAVCEQKSEHIVCSDKLFAICNGTEHLVDESNLNFSVCNNTMRIDDTKVTGNVILDKEWVDPRKQ